MAQYTVNFIISVPTEGRVAQMGSCCQIYLCSTRSVCFVYPAQTLGRDEKVLCPSQKSRAVKDVNCKTRIPKDPCKGAASQQCHATTAGKKQLWLYPPYAFALPLHRESIFRQLGVWSYPLGLL